MQVSKVGTEANRVAVRALVVTILKDKDKETMVGVMVLNNPLAETLTIRVMMLRDEVRHSLETMLVVVVATLLLLQLRRTVVLAVVIKDTVATRAMIKLNHQHLHILLVEVHIHKRRLTSSMVDNRHMVVLLVHNHLPSTHKDKVTLRLHRVTETPVHTVLVLGINLTLEVAC